MDTQPPIELGSNNISDITTKDSNQEGIDDRILKATRELKRNQATKSSLLAEDTPEIKKETVSKEPTSSKLKSQWKKSVLNLLKAILQSYRNRIMILESSYRAMIPMRNQ